MVASIAQTISKTKESKEILSQTAKTTSVDSRYLRSDPDLLIREYFLSSSAKRKKLRKLVFQNIRSDQSILAILIWSRRTEVSDAYEGASDLLAECADIHLLKAAIKYLETAIPLASSLDDFWEVLIKGISYAYQIPAEDRFQVISSLFSVSNTRIFKAAIIDALIILADETDTELTKTSLDQFLSPHEQDLYIRNYAEEALQEIS